MTDTVLKKCLDHPLFQSRSTILLSCYVFFLLLDMLFLLPSVRRHSSCAIAQHFLLQRWYPSKRERERERSTCHLMISTLLPCCLQAAFFSMCLYNGKQAFLYDTREGINISPGWCAIPLLRTTRIPRGWSQLWKEQSPWTRRYAMFGCVLLSSLFRFFWCFP